MNLHQLSCLLAFSSLMPCGTVNVKPHVVPANSCRRAQLLSPICMHTEETNEAWCQCQQQWPFSQIGTWGKLPMPHSVVSWILWNEHGPEDLCHHLGEHTVASTAPKFSPGVTSHPTVGCIGPCRFQDRCWCQISFYASRVLTSKTLLLTFSMTTCKIPAHPWLQYVVVLWFTEILQVSEHQINARHQKAPVEEKISIFLKTFQSLQQQFHLFSLPVELVCTHIPHECQTKCF